MQDSVMDFNITLSIGGDLLAADASSDLGECYATSAWPRPEERELDSDALGELLFQRLFPGPVQSLYQQSRGRLMASADRLRLRIRASAGSTTEELARIHSIPWEIVRDPHGQGFLALDPQIQLVRYLNLAAAVPHAFHMGALKILVAAASPSDLTQLRWEEEAAAIERAFAETSAGVTILRHATRNHLLEMLGTQRYNVLHFIGHGGAPNEVRTGGIMLENAHGGSDWVTAQELAMITQVTNSLHLVFLNSCSTAALAARSHLNLAASVGPALALRGIPAVVGMVRAVYDPDAIAFAAGVYSRLRDGAALEAAVHAARIAVRLGGVQGESWTIPVVFSRMAAGRANAAPVAMAPPPVVPAAGPPEQRAINKLTVTIGKATDTKMIIGATVGGFGTAGGSPPGESTASFQINEIAGGTVIGGVAVENDPGKDGST